MVNDFWNLALLLEAWSGGNSLVAYIVDVNLQWQLFAIFWPVVQRIFNLTCRSSRLDTRNQFVMLCTIQTEVSKLRIRRFRQ